MAELATLAGGTLEGHKAAAARDAAAFDALLESMVCGEVFGEIEPCEAVHEDLVHAPGRGKTPRDTSWHAAAKASALKRAQPALQLKTPWFRLFGRFAQMRKLGRANQTKLFGVLTRSRRAQPSASCSFSRRTACRRAMAATSSARRRK